MKWGSEKFQEGLECQSCGNIRELHGRVTKCPKCNSYSKCGNYRTAQRYVTLRMRKGFWGGWKVVDVKRSRHSVAVG